MLTASKADLIIADFGWSMRISLARYQCNSLPLLDLVADDSLLRDGIG